MNSKLKIKGPQITSISNNFIKVNPGHKGSLHDSILKLRNDLANVVIKVNQLFFFKRGLLALRKHIKWKILYIKGTR